MGFSMKRWDYEKSKNYCSCEPTHDQVQPETRRGVSGSNSEAQRQNLLRSRSALLRLFKNCLSTTQTSKLWGCVLGGDRGERDSLRLDRGSPGQAKAPLHQEGAQDGSPAWVQNLGRLGNIRASQERRRKIRWRARSRHRSRNFKSCPELGQLSSSKKQQATGSKHQASSDRRQASQPSATGGWVGPQAARLD